MSSELRSYVERNPGVHFNEIVSALELTPDKLNRQAERLTAEGRIAATELYGKTHFYPSEYEPWERKAVALLRRETAREILFYLLENDSASPTAVAESVGIARSTLEWHLDRLVDAGLVHKERENWAVELVVRDPDRIAGLLDDLEPTLLERWLDRTPRLLDHLFETDL